MKFLKGLAITIVGFLLFLSISAFSTVFMLKQTLINPDFAVAELNQLDTAKLGKEMLGDQIKAQLPPELSSLSGAVDGIFDEMAPWFKERMGDITYAVFDYLSSRSERLSVAISLEPVKTSIETKIKQVLEQSPPPEIAALPAAQRTQFIDQLAQGSNSVSGTTFGGRSRAGAGYPGVQ